MHVHIVHFGDGIIVLDDAEAAEAVLQEVGFQGPEGGDLKWGKWVRGCHVRYQFMLFISEAESSYFTVQKRQKPCLRGRLSEA